MIIWDGQISKEKQEILAFIDGKHLTASVPSLHRREANTFTANQNMTFYKAQASRQKLGVAGEGYWYKESFFLKHGLFLFSSAMDGTQIFCKG